MTEVSVNASKKYIVTIGSGVLHRVGETIRALTNAKKVCIISDSHVFPLYGGIVSESLHGAGLDSCSFLFPAGENSKNAQTYLELLNFLAQIGLTRSDCIVALGGGVVGDLAGFAAATYLRGIPYIQVPTTLLAMVDSSVGGKTGIDLPSGKNLAGVFYQPDAVICDMDTLDTLPAESFQDGCSEVIKYGMLYDPTLFSHLEKAGLSFDRESVIARCVALKSQVVTQDELDTDRRQLLNLGHTIGHAIEACSHFAVSHGRAVSIGMAMVARAAKCNDTDRLLSLLQKFGLPIRTDLSPDALLEVMLADKKRRGDTLNLILPKAIGNCAIMPTPTVNLKTFIEEGI